MPHHYPLAEESQSPQHNHYLQPAVVGGKDSIKVLLAKENLSCPVECFHQVVSVFPVASHHNFYAQFPEVGGAIKEVTWEIALFPVVKGILSIIWSLQEYLHFHVGQR